MENSEDLVLYKEAKWAVGEENVGYLREIINQLENELNEAIKSAEPGVMLDVWKDEISGHIECAKRGINVNSLDLACRNIFLTERYLINEVYPKLLGKKNGA